MGMINLADVVEENGLTIRENNMRSHHSIAIGTLVEVNCDYIEEHGVRLFVCSHDRDCDGTPLYGLSFNKNAGKEVEKIENDLKKLDRSTDEYAFTFWALRKVEGSITSGFSEESLVIVK